MPLDLRTLIRLSEHIEQIQLIPERSDHSPRTSDSSAVPKLIVMQGLPQFKESFTSTAIKLERYMQDIMGRMFVKFKSGMRSEEDIACFLISLEDGLLCLVCGLVNRSSRSLGFCNLYLPLSLPEPGIS
jgi:hypothetical protein